MAVSLKALYSGLYRRDLKTPVNPIGYARASTTDQARALQRDALNAAGCERIVTDQGISASIAERLNLHKALGELTPGDSLVVWKFDHFGRSLTHLVQTISELMARQP